VVTLLSRRVRRHSQNRQYSSQCNSHSVILSNQSWSRYCPAHRRSIGPKAKSGLSRFNMVRQATLPARSLVYRQSSMLFEVFWGSNDASRTALLRHVSCGISRTPNPGQGACSGFWEAVNRLKMAVYGQPDTLPSRGTSPRVAFHWPSGCLMTEGTVFFTESCQGLQATQPLARKRGQARPQLLRGGIPPSSVPRTRR